MELAASRGMLPPKASRSFSVASATSPLALRKRSVTLISKTTLPPDSGHPVVANVRPLAMNPSLAASATSASLTFTRNGCRAPEFH